MRSEAAISKVVSVDTMFSLFLRFSAVMSCQLEGGVGKSRSRSRLRVRGELGSQWALASTKRFADSMRSQPASLARCDTASIEEEDELKTTQEVKG